MLNIENNYIFNEGEKLKKGLINVKKTYDQVRSISKQKDPVDNKPSDRQGKNKNKKWKDVMSFLEKNPNVLMDIIPNDLGNVNVFHENNRQGVINFRNVTGISAPGRGKYQPMVPKPDTLIAPWKLATHTGMLNKDIKNTTKKRAKNTTSKRKTGYQTKASNSKSNELSNPKSNEIPNQKSTPVNNTILKNKIKLHATSRSGIMSQPSSLTNNKLQSKLASRNISSKPNLNSAGGNNNNGFKMYQTPSFLSPHTNSESTEKIPSMTTFSNTSTQKQHNNGSSMVDQHTIIFESEEGDDGQSDAATQAKKSEKKSK
jgi:hypothetical protein